MKYKNMESKLFKLITWIEQDKINISSVAYNSILELIETGETSVTKDTPHGLSDWSGEIRSIFARFDIRVYSGNNSGKYFKIKTPKFLTECDYYLFEKEMPGMVAKAEEIVNQIDTNIIQTLESTNFRMKTYLAMAETVEFDWLEIVRTMPDCNKNRKLTDKERITKIINKS